MEPMRKLYEEEIIPQLMQEFEYDNIMQVPKLEKIVVNMGVGEAQDNPNALDSAVEEMTQICGQRPTVNRAKKSVSAFRIRQGDPIGCSVTLRREYMWSFLTRLINIALPRVRDFRGINPNSFDGRGNYSLGLEEQTVFPEVDYETVDQVRGMDIAIVTTAETDEEARFLLRALGMPFRVN